MDTPATGIRVIPPLLFLAAFLIAWGFHWLWPLSLGLPLWPRAVAGLIVTLAALVAFLHLLFAFRRVGASYETVSLPKTLVTGGLYRWSRNPGYVDLIVLGIGIAIFFDNWWVIILMVPAIVIVRQEAILKEEALLEAAFGDEYRQYKARVRRWL
jgi:protein-S-isoprenylcysteine O-methyltransferase Ste14